ncbi:hypothetical protein ACN4DJ_05875 [Corynebacterium macclintockiae]|uniref:hypothetical protein n=1 Tax=Corynebacterium macclintockiae TaxID=2913501 RepID=UPI003EBDBBB4
MTSKHKHWKVWKQQRWAPKPYWVVTSPEYSECGFPTHAEALAYADRMARTVEVTLPRRTNDIGGYLGVRYNPTTRCMEIYSLFHDHKYPIHYNEAEGVALALLAHHYTNQAS